MFLENGYELQGLIGNSIVNINNEWKEILVIETNNLTDMQAIELLKDNREIMVKNIESEIVYRHKDVLDVIVEDTKTYIWLDFDYRYIRQVKDIELQNQLTQTANYTLELDYRLSEVELGLGTGVI